ncbi:MAG: cell division protein FtsZ, partial [Sphingomicrobium sp.]
ASHIKELVDPDANIIWGSAFNNDLGGKIRVSVVATGIEAEAGALPQQPAKVFTFPPRPATPPTGADGPDPGLGDDGGLPDLELGADDEGDELLLGNDDILTSPVGAPPIEPPADEDDEAPAAGTGPGAAGGATLFERMSNIARGAPKAQLDDEDDEEGTIEIPRFLNRQNNQ